MKARVSRRGLLTAAGGSAVGAAAVAGGWLAVDSLRTPAAHTNLVTSNKFDHAMRWTELGTRGGPVAGPDRSQPAHLLHSDNQAILVDVGDGAAGQLAKAGVDLRSVRSVVVSHLHIDHTGGLHAILGMRQQTHVPGELTIYGPPGTRELVNGIEAAQRYLPDLVGAENSRVRDLPPTTVKVIEVTDGSAVTIGSVKVTAATNTHYGFSAGSEQAKRFQSLSYRFDTPDRSIVYTGDTGPSDNVERLARNADLLVSEIIDPDHVMALLKAQRVDIPFYAEPLLRNHFEHQHLTADAVGLLAQHARVKTLVLTHNTLDAQGIVKAGETIASRYKGPFAFANDLDNY